MKTTVIIQTEYSDEDKILLQKSIPENPCDSCPVPGTGACCGCPEARKYEEAIKPYRDSNIYDIAQDIARMNKLETQARALIDEYQRLNQNLPLFAQRPALSITRNSYF